MCVIPILQITDYVRVYMLGPGCVSVGVCLWFVSHNLSIVVMSVCVCVCACMSDKHVSRES